MMTQDAVDMFRSVADLLEFINENGWELDSLSEQHIKDALEILRNIQFGISAPEGIMRQL